MLELVDLDRTIPKREYKERLPPLRRRLLTLQQALWEERIPSIVVFEGWDAAGKGSCIRKLTERLEPRGFDLRYVPDVPRSTELELPWLWRFWESIPSYGKMAIFDRSWNRRAILRRVEGEASELEWCRLLRDIGDFERVLADDGYVFVKFFLHIGEKEQQRRYEKWLADPGQSWKALEKDWEKPTHYGERRVATEELLQHTEAAWSPWTLVSATDQRWVRLRVFETLVERLEDALATRGIELPDEDLSDENGENGGENGDEEEAE